MKILIAGGSGFLGSAIANTMQLAGHKVWILTRKKPKHSNEIHWDGKTAGEWIDRIADMDAVINVTGFGLEHWPWTERQKQRFHESRVNPGIALVSAIKQSQNRPEVMLQISGINFYGTEGETIADEWTPPGDDFLAQLTVQWEASTQPIEEMGVRRIIARTAVVLDSHAGLFPRMVLPVRLFVGGPLGDGRQAMPWIHLADQTGALRFLLEDDKTRGVFNLISPTPTSNATFMRAIAEILHRPYWLNTPTFLLKGVLGEMSVLVVEGRYSKPRRLVEYGYKFQYPNIENAVRDLFGRESS